MSELLPCPFCGGEASIVDHHNDDGSVSVGCANDTCLGFSGLGWLYATEAEAIEAWNIRAERTCEPVVDSQDGLVCSECGSSALVRDWVEMHSWGGGYERVRFATYDYCPNCGAKVVNNDN